MSAEFIAELEELLKKHNAKLWGSYPADVDLEIGGRQVGFWSGEVTTAGYKEFS